MKLHGICAAALLCAAPAFAAGPGALGTIDNTPVVIGNVLAPGPFTDIYTFTLADPGMLSGGVNDIAIPPALQISLSFAVELYDGASALVGTDSSPGSFSFAGLAAGAYALHVVGNAVGDIGGMYAGGLLAETAPVPEPETYALMLAGVAAVGFIVSRRRRG